MTATTEARKGRVKRSGSVGDEAIAGMPGASKAVLLGPEDGVPNFFLRRFRIESGHAIALHTNEVEHEQYVLSGRARMRIGDEVFEVAAGDVVYIPARVPHDYAVLGTEAFEFLCMVPNRPDELRKIEEKQGGCCG